MRGGIVKIEFNPGDTLMFNGKKVEGIEIKKNSEGEFIEDLSIENLVPIVNEEQYRRELHAKWDKISEESPIPWRYQHRCTELFYLAKQQLNLPKNAAKGNFEDLCDFRQIMQFLKSEVDEVERELTDVQLCCETCMEFNEVEKEKINYQRAREEIGDVAACLVGLLAKLDKMEKEEER